MSKNFTKIKKVTINLNDAPDEDCIYKLDDNLLSGDNLLKAEYDYDESGIYVPYTAEYQSIGCVNVDGIWYEDDDYKSKFHTANNIYLKIYRDKNSRKDILIKCKWTFKTPDGYVPTESGFNIECEWGEIANKYIKLDKKGNLKSNELTANASFSARDLEIIPASKGSYVNFIDDMRRDILNCNGLEVLKDKNYKWLEMPEEEDAENDEEVDETPKTFSDYPKEIQNQALTIINEGKVFEELQKSVSLTHEGHKTTRDALILMEASLFTGDGAHGLLGGDSGEGKSDLAFAVAYNFPSKHVHILRNISPKNIYYDFENYNDDFNILILDDLPFNEDLVNLCKELADNAKKVKELKTVINGKSYTFRLKGKYIVIITYAKTIPDEELANRLFNVGVSIVDKEELGSHVKEKIRDNNVIGGNENLIIERKRLTMQACIHYLIEQKTNVFNPFISIFNPSNYNNRDVNHFINMVKARTFFEAIQRKQIKINDELSITIGSYDDINFVHEIWAKDEKTQLYKLSERQKKILDLLPEMDSTDAFDYVEKLNEKLKKQTRAEQKKSKDNEPFAKSLARKLKCNVSTLKHDLDRVNDGTHKSLIEMGLVEKIQLDEKNKKSPNFYYKIKDEGVSSNPNESDVHDGKIQFAHSLNSPIVKQKIIINLLIYANIIINKKGISYLKKYCENYKEEINVEDYDSYYNFLQSFFDGLDNNQHIINLNNSSSNDINEMFEFQDELNKRLKIEEAPPKTQNNQKICTSKEINENTQNTNQSENKNANQDFPILHISNLKFKNQMKEIGVDVEIACKTYELLTSGFKTLQEIINYIYEYIDPEDFNNETTPLKIKNNVNKLYKNNYIDLKSNKYILQESFIELVDDTDKENDGKC